MEKEIDKLGTVLAVSNQINKDMLDMLRSQQQRQTRIIWASIGIVGMAVVVVGMTVFFAFSSLDKIAAQVERNRVQVERNAEALANERYKADSETAAK